MKVIRSFFLALILLFPFGELIRFEEGNGFAINVNDVAVLGITVIWIMHALAIAKRRTLLFPFYKPIGLFVLIGLLSLLVNSSNYKPNELLIGSLYLLRWVSYAGLFFIVANFDMEFKRSIFKLLIAASAVFLLFGFVQYFLYSSLRNLYYLGWDEHRYRLFSSFFDPNYAGAFLGLSVLLILSTLFNYKNKLKKKFTIGLSVLCFFTFIGFLLTYSRSAYILLFVGLASFFVIIKKQKLIAVVLALSLFLFLLASRNFSIENLNLLRAKSTVSRLETMQHALIIIKDHPILGVGFNTYRYAQHRYGFLGNGNWQNSHSGAGVDNSYLFVLATSGILGLFSYIYLFFSLFKKSKTDYLKADSPLRKTVALTVAVSMAGLFVNALFINSLFYIFFMEWMWILFGLMDYR